MADVENKPETTETGEVTGNRNQSRLDHLNAIAEANDSERDLDRPIEEQVAGKPEKPQEAPEVEASPAVETPAEATIEVVEQAPDHKKYKLKILGEEREVTEDELIRRAQKNESADHYLAEAAKLYRQAQEYSAQNPEVPQPSRDVDEDLGLARAIQMGTEQEALEAIRKIRTAQPPPMDAAAVVRDVENRMSFRQAVTWARKEYQDIFGDPDLEALFLTKDRNLVDGQDSRAYEDRYKEIGDGIRAKFKTPSVQFEAKESRKASVTTLPRANSRAVVPAQDEPVESVSQTIAGMAKARGQVLA